jgi:uncharacterized protein
MPNQLTVPDVPVDQSAPDQSPSHPDQAKPGRNDIIVDTMHYGYKRMVFEKDVLVTLRDGTIVFVNVFRPHYDGRFPVVVSFDFYGKDSMHIAFGMPAGGPYTLGQYGCSPFAAWEAPDPGFWVPNEYVVVKAAARGTSGSKGKISAMSEMETWDFHDIIEWCGTQPWSNGNVVTNGVSYLAMTQWRVGQLNPTHLKAMIPWEGVSDLYREWAFHGGIPETSFCPFLDGMLKKKWPGCDIDELDVGKAEHPFLDEYWQARHGNLADIRVPLLVCASWSTQGLHNRGTIEGFRQASSPDKWLVVHGRKEWETYFSREALERQLRFCDYFLKGIENDWDKVPRVSYELRERFYDGITKTSDRWPLPGTQYTALYLDAARGALVHELPAAPAALTYDSGAANADGGRAVFAMRFDKDTELTGYMKLRLWVSADASDMDLFVGIRKFDRRGRELHFPDFNHIEHGLVARGWLRVSHRELDENRSTPYQPWLKHQRIMPIPSGDTVPVDIEIWPTSILFRAGETLQLIVQGGEIAYTRSNPLPLKHGRICTGHSQTVNRGIHRIHAGGKFDSHLLVPVIG